MTKDDGHDTVLYIAGLWQMLPEDAIRKGRSSPLGWGKFRSPADSSEAGIRYQMKRQAIKATRGGLTSLAIYDEILGHYGFGRTAALRGWLVNHHYRAATAAQIGQVIGVADVAAIKRAIKALIDVCLLERVQRPDIEAAIRADRTILPVWDGQTDDAPDVSGEEVNEAKQVDEAPAAAGEETPAAPPTEAADGRPVSGRRPADGRPAAGPRPGDVRQETRDRQTPPAAPAAPPPPTAHGNGQTGDFRQPAPAAPLPADGEPGDGQAPHSPLETADAPPGGTPTGDGGTRGDQTPGGQAGATEAVQAGDAAPAAPTHHPPGAEPDEPTEADPEASSPACEGAEGFGGGESAYVEAIDVMVRDVGQALYPTREDLVIEGRKARPPQGPEEFERRERGALVVAWAAAVKLGLGPVEFMELHRRAIKEATTIRRKRTKKPKGACWRWWFNKHMEAAVGPAAWAKTVRMARGFGSSDAAGPGAGQSEAR